MPSHAMAAVPSAHVATLADIPALVDRLGRRSVCRCCCRVTAGADPEFEALLEFSATSRGFDFTGYKRSEPHPPRQKRMDAVGVDDYAAYREHLERHPEEFADALQHDPDQRHGVLPRPAGVGVPRDRGRPAHRSSAKPAEPIRVWTPGARPAKRPTRSRSCFAEALGVDDLPRARQDLRDRRRRGGARYGAPRRVHARSSRDGARRAARALLRAGRRRLRVPQRVAARRSSSAATT